MEPYAPALLARLAHWPRTNRQRFRGGSHATCRADRSLALATGRGLPPPCYGVCRLAIPSFCSYEPQTPTWSALLVVFRSDHARTLFFQLSNRLSQAIF